MSDERARKGKGRAAAIPKTEPMPAIGSRWSRSPDEVTSPFIDTETIQPTRGHEPPSPVTEVSPRLGPVEGATAGTGGWEPAMPEPPGAEDLGPAFDWDESAPEGVRAQAHGTSRERASGDSERHQTATVIVPEASVGIPGEEAMPPGRPTERTEVTPQWPDTTQTGGRREPDPWAELDDEATPAVPERTAPRSAPLPPEDTIRSDTGAGRSDQTVLLDREMQDRLMALRAQQDAELRQRFGGEVVVMFTDLVGSTAYYEKHGDLMGRQKMLTHNALLFPIIRAHEGTIIKTIGDAIMCCFQAVDEALAAAVEMQRALRSFNQGCQDRDEEIHIRIGINSGHAIAEDGDLHGDAVNVAARVEAKAEGDEILVSEAVRRAASRGTFEDQGRIQLKGKAERINVYRLVWAPGPQDERPGGERMVGGRYRLKDAIGRGPVGVVYAAEDQQLRVGVALKRLHEFVSHDPQTMEAFRERFASIAALHHEGIVRVSDYATDGDEPYYVMDRVEGEDLAAWVSRHGARDPEQALPIVLDLCRAASYAHGQGVVHGNIKPENVFVRASDGRAVLGDFGVGAVHRAQRTRTGRSVASPAFMAPEQVTAAPPSPATDVYGLGAVLYFLLAGRPPYQPTATLEAMRAVAAGKHTPLASARRGLGARLVEVVERAMATDPVQRFATVAELAAALEQEQERQARPRRKVSEPLRPMPKGLDVGGSGASPSELRTLRRALIAVSVVALTAIVGVVALAGLLLAREGRAPGVVAVASDVEPPTPLEPVEPPALEPEGPGVETGDGLGQQRAGQDLPPGRVLLSTAPFAAEVWVDDVRVGRTPRLKELELSAGPHTLRIVHPKRQVHIERIDVQAGKVLRKRIKLRPR